MSVFISYNYQTGHQTALELEAELRRHGIDAWWLPEKLLFEQLDQTIETAMASCQRCIVIWSTPKLTGWQQAEISDIRQRLVARQPPADTIDFFMVLRDCRNSEIPRGGTLPLLDCAEYVDYGLISPTLPSLDYLVGYTPGITPLMSGDGQRPFFHLLEGEATQGRRAFTGGFRTDPNAPVKKEYCWLFLEDKRGRWYLQQPRPTRTHAHRWIAPSVHIGANISSVLLIAASPAAHKYIVANVLAANYGALVKKSLGRITVLDSLRLNLKVAKNLTGTEEPPQFKDI